MVTRAIAAAILVVWSLPGQTREPSTLAPEVNRTVGDLRQISKDLAEAVRRFNSRLDETAAKFDRGERSAEADLKSPPEIVQTAVRKALAFRMLASRGERYQPAALQDFDRIQSLIAQARGRAAESTTLLRRMDVVPFRDVTFRSDAEVKSERDQLLRARSLAERTAEEAYAALPVEASEPETANPSGPPGMNLGADDFSAHPVSANPAPVKPHDDTKDTLPLHIQHRRLVTLVKENWCRVALTDSGVEDNTGRHVFYEEEWIQRGEVVLRKRWRVAVDAATGQHILLKRYPPIELAGQLAAVYDPLNTDRLWYIEPPEGAAEPSADELNRAAAEVEHARAAVRDAASAFTRIVRDLMDHQEPLDVGLPANFRESLFAIRADLGRVPAVVEAEKNVRQSIEASRGAAGDLEPLAAWANRISEEVRPVKMTFAEWDRVLQKSGRSLDQLRMTEKEALRLLPPDMSKPEAEFPELGRNMVVRIRRLPSADAAVRCLQEIWLLEAPMPEIMRVRRTATLVVIDSNTGAQTLTRTRTIYYPARADEALEQIFDENAADDILPNPGS